MNSVQTSSDTPTSPSPAVRDERYDIAKGVAIILVVVGHSIQFHLSEFDDNPVFRAIYSFHMPLFMAVSGAVAALGAAAFHLAGHVTGLKLESLSADLQSFGSGRRLDDDAHVALRYKGGARGALWASQIAPGHDDGLRLRVYGAKGGLEWAQEAPNQLWFAPYGEPKRLLTRGGAGAGLAAARATRLPAGHPEGWLEALANLYGDCARAIRARQAGEAPDPAPDLPGAAEGLEGAGFVEACLRSARADSRWTALDFGA